jgi:hypothetical protein
MKEVLCFIEAFITKNEGLGKYLRNVKSKIPTQAPAILEVGTALTKKFT